MTSLSESLNEYATVIITGGSSGIGKSFIELMGNLGLRALVCNLSRRSPNINSGQLKVRHFPCDLSDEAAVSSTIEEIVLLLNREVPDGRVLLINNSGFGTYGAFLDHGLSEQLEMLAVNNRAAVQITGLLLPLLLQRGGAIINVASTAALQPTPLLATYAATKAFILSWSIALQSELRGRGVHVLAVCPGPTSTGFASRAGLAEGSVPRVVGQTPEEVAATALRALVSRQTWVICGWKNKFVAVFAATVPRTLAARIAGWVVAKVRPTSKVKSQSK